MTQERNSKSNCVVSNVCLHAIVNRLKSEQVCGIRPKQGLLRVCGRTCAEKLKSMRSSGGPTPVSSYLVLEVYQFPSTCSTTKQDASGTHFPSVSTVFLCKGTFSLLTLWGLTCADT